VSSSSVSASAPPVRSGSAPRPRICHLAKYYPPHRGGIESHVQNLARAQTELGADVEVVCVDHSVLPSRDILGRAISGCVTSTEWDGPIRVTRVGRVANLSGLDLCPMLPGLLRDLAERFEILHLQTPNPTMLLPLAALSSHARLVITHQSDVIRQRGLRRLLRPAQDRVYRRAASILCSSPAYADGSDLLRCYEHKLEVLPLGIDLRSYLDPSPGALEHAARLRERFPGPRWLAVGRLVYYKGHEVALRALAHVEGRLLVAGVGPLERELRLRSRELGISARVAWLGEVEHEELVGAYLGATALWFPSNQRSEAFGLAQVEAMASGCPVINTAIPFSGVPWVCPHEEAGLTVPVNDPLALARAAQRLLNEPGLRERLSAGARANASARFDHVRMGLRSLELYQCASSPAEVSQ